MLQFSFESTSLTFLDLETLEAPKAVVECTLLSPELCKTLHKDSFTIVLTIWAILQLTWVTMLLCVQLLQIARNLTTYESMRGHLHAHTPADALNSFVTTGSTSQDTAGLGSEQDTGDAPRRRHAKASIWDQWKRLLGLDTFVAIALHGSRAEEMQRRRAGGNPFSRGIITNCSDFWCDGSAIFGKKEGGYARIGGERVDYTRLYEVPKPTTTRTRSTGGERYESVAGEEEEAGR